MEEKSSSTAGISKSIVSVRSIKTKSFTSRAKSTVEETATRETVKVTISIPGFVPARNDKWMLVYLTILVSGMGTLLPWDMFITAKDYFVDYKLSVEYTGAVDDINGIKQAGRFLFYVEVASQFPSMICHWVNIFFHFGTVHPHKRILWSLVLEIAFFMCVIIMGIVDTSKTPKLFFGFTIFLVVLISTVGAVFESCLFGLASKLDYSGALVLGVDIAGTFVATVNLITLAASATVRKAAILYFSSAVIILVLCLIAVFILPRNTYYCHKVKEDETGNTNIITPLLTVTSESAPASTSDIGIDSTVMAIVVTEAEVEVELPEPEKPPILSEVLARCKKSCLNIFGVYFVTLSIFPYVHTDIKRVKEDFILPEKYFTPAACFFTFNFLALWGGLLAEKIQWPSPERLWIPVAVRSVFIPFFVFLCNYEPPAVTQTHHLHTDDYLYWFCSACFGFTHGYFGSVALLYSICSVSEPSHKHLELAGMLGAAFLSTGICCGILFSFSMPYLVSWPSPP